jgi:hypothetical protein
MIPISTGLIFILIGYFKKIDVGILNKHGIIFKTPNTTKADTIKINGSQIY